MARLVAIANGLYYPTPLRVIAGIAPLLELPATSNSNQILRALDPCAGRGTAALFLSRLLTRRAGVNATTTNSELFGIELDAQRAELAAPLFFRFLQTNALTARVEQKSFDLLFHNPPYHDSGDEDRRLEHAFLKRTTAYLKPGGVLIHIVPQAHLAISADYLAYYYRDISVLRFPDPEYAAFKQVVLVAVRRESGLEDKATAKKLKDLAIAGPQFLPQLDCPASLTALENAIRKAEIPNYPEVREELERLDKSSKFELAAEFSPGMKLPPVKVKYRLTLSQANRPIALFANGEYSANQALAEARANGVWANRQLRELVCPVSEAGGQAVQRPLTPLREGQAAMLTAVGLLNNLVLEDADGHRALVKGRTFKEYKLKKVEQDEDGNVKSRTEREVIKSQLTVLDLQNGEAKEIEQTEMSAFIQRYAGSIRAQMLSNYPPLYLPGQNNPVTRKVEAGLVRLLRKPLGGQALAIVAGAYSLILNRCAIFSCEMGTGKSLQGAAAAWLSGGRRILVECPPQLVKKWVREIKQTVPGARAEIVTNLTELRRAVRQINYFETHLPNFENKQADSGLETRAPYFVVISRMDLKLGSRWQSAAMLKSTRNAEGEKVILLYCPRCGNIVLDRDEKPLALDELGRKKLKCSAPRRVWNTTTKSWSNLSFGKNGLPLLCNEPLWQTKCTPVSAPKTDRTRTATRPFASPGDTLVQEGPRKIPLSQYIKSHLDGFFDTLIEDEVHEVKAEGSAQGTSAGVLAGSVKRVISLTGTLSGGKASNLFFLLWRFSQEIRREFRLDEEERWVQRYGIVERTLFSKTEDNRDVVEDGAMSDRREWSHERRVEKPGMNPAILLKLVGCTVFLKLADVARDLPPYSEKVIAIPLAGEESDPTSQAHQYFKFEKDLVSAVKLALQNGSNRLLGAMANSLLSWPDNPTRSEVVIDPKLKLPVAEAQALPAEIVYPKEKALLDLYRKERATGRRMLIFLSNTKSRSIVARVKEVLEKAGARVGFLNSDRVKPEDREEWVARQVQAGIDVLLSHPKPIQTGLDLLQWPTLVFYQLHYSTYVMRQASRRSWRIGQKQPITVYHFVYEDTAQQTGLTLIAKKVRASQMLEGELSNDGLVEIAEDGDDGESLMELARAIAGKGELARLPSAKTLAKNSGASETSELSNLSLEELFKSLHQTELETARFVLEDENAGQAELEAAIQRLYEGVTASATLESTSLTQATFKAENVESQARNGQLSAPEEARQLILPSIPQPGSVRQKPTLEELRATFLEARQKKLTTRKTSSKVSPQQLSMF